MDPGKRIACHEENLDAIIYLSTAVPHIFEHICGDLLSYGAFVELQKISRWQLALLPVWKKHWERKVREIPVWMTLFERIQCEFLFMKNANYYRDLCRLVEERLQRIENNFKYGSSVRIAQATVKLAKDLLQESQFSTSDLLVNHKHVIVASSYRGKGVIEMFNRWTSEKLNIRYGFKRRVKRLQCNTHYLVCQLESTGLFKVLSVDTQKKFQTIRIKLDAQFGNRRLFNDCFFLTEELLYYVALVSGDGVFPIVAVNTYRVNPSTGHFKIFQRRGFVYYSYYSHFDPKVYVDSRYFILDCDDSNRHRLSRCIQVRRIETLELVHDQSFLSSKNIKKEYQNGTIVALTKENGQLCVVVWDVYKNITKRIIGHPLISDLPFCSSASVTHFTDYQIVADKSDGCKLKILSKTENAKANGSLITIDPFRLRKRMDWSQLDLLSFYFDGVQFIGIFRSDRVVILNLI